MFCLSYQFQTKMVNENSLFRYFQPNCIFQDFYFSSSHLKLHNWCAFYCCYLTDSFENKIMNENSINGHFGPIFSLKQTNFLIRVDYLYTVQVLFCFYNLNLTQNSDISTAVQNACLTLFSAMKLFVVWAVQ